MTLEVRYRTEAGSELIGGRKETIKAKHKENMFTKQIDYNPCVIKQVKVFISFTRLLVHLVKSFTEVGNLVYLKSS